MAHGLQAALADHFYEQSDLSWHCGPTLAGATPRFPSKLVRDASIFIARFPN